MKFQASQLLVPTNRTKIDKFTPANKDEEQNMRNGAKGMEHGAWSMEIWTSGRVDDLDEWTVDCRL